MASFVRCKSAGAARRDPHKARTASGRYARWISSFFSFNPPFPRRRKRRELANGSVRSTGRERGKGMTRARFPSNKVSRGNPRYRDSPCRMSVHNRFADNGKYPTVRQKRRHAWLFPGSRSELVALERAKRQWPEGYPFFLRLPRYIFHLSDARQSLELLKNAKIILREGSAVT